MKYTVEQFLDNRWTRHNIGGMSLAENTMDLEEDAHNVISELREHPEWTMAQLRVAVLGKEPDSE